MRTCSCVHPGARPAADNGAEYRRIPWWRSALEDVPGYDALIGGTWARSEILVRPANE